MKKQENSTKRELLINTSRLKKKSQNKQVMFIKFIIQT
nr:MAG TPA: hypothetical protein [Caudoviricetes sp.]